MEAVVFWGVRCRMEDIVCVGEAVGFSVVGGWMGGAYSVRRVVSPACGGMF